MGIAPTKSQGIRVYGGGQSRPPLRCKARSRAKRDGGDVEDAVPYKQKDSAPAGAVLVYEGVTTPGSFPSPC